MIGFAVWTAGNGLWILWGLQQEAWGIIGQFAVFWALAIRGLVVNRRAAKEIS
jgi:hypothetical protein